MRVYAVINMKGGVGKTISSVNIAHILAAVHGKRVLLVDCDKQGNASKHFGVYTYETASLTDVLTIKNYSAAAAIQPTPHEDLHILPANMTLLKANKDILLDVSRPQQTRLQKALAGLDEVYDYCVIDCAPDINMSTINAMVAAHAILVPLVIDKYAFDGLAEFIDQMEGLQEFNPRLYVMGAFATMTRADSVNAGGIAWLRENSPIPMFDTTIRARAAVVKTTYTGDPLLVYAPKCAATQDYIALVGEILQREM